MKKKSLPLYEIISLLIGELTISLVICGVYLLIHKFSYKVITGAALGTSVMVLNFLFLAIYAARAFDKAAKLRGDKEMSDEEIERFTEKHTAEINNAIKLSFIIRTVSMLAALIVAFILEWFDVIATVIPLLAFRPIITVSALIKEKLRKGDDQ